MFKVFYAKDKIRIDSKNENKNRSNLKNIYSPSDSYLNKNQDIIMTNEAI